jgi:hypothetical protein
VGGALKLCFIPVHGPPPPPPSSLHFSETAYGKLAEREFVRLIGEAGLTFRLPAQNPPKVNRHTVS